MLQIAKTEWLKIKNYRAFWWVMGITALTYPGINYMTLALYNEAGKEGRQREMVKMLIGNPFSFPETWHTTAYFSSLFIFIPAIVIIMLITNEYTYKTNRQNIIDGWSRRDFMIAKLMDVIILSAIVTVLYAVVALAIGIGNTPPENAGTRWDQVYYVGLFALQSFSQLSLAFLTGFLLRKSFIALAVFSFYFIIAEPVAVKVLKFKFHNEIGRFFPREISDRLLPVPAFIGKFDEKAYKAALDAIHYHVIYTIILLAITWGFCFRINNRRDL
ncbi:MAG: ABC transporter permease [Bacteroidetes bacterium]|nr:ABC transporter permease [Bacteroidota bacterium]